MFAPPVTHDLPALYQRSLFSRGRPAIWWLSLVLLVSGVAGCAVIDPRQRDLPPPGVSYSETITVDGLPERLLIRGRDPVHNPVLLFIHGGPGFPAAVFRQVNSDLERDFTVVHWDQRGAGYSYFKGLPTDKMRVEQFVRETLLVSRALCREFRQPKIYLVGHSWGTLPAILAVQREPKLFYGYVALSQLVDLDESERRLTQAAIHHAHRLNEREKAEKLSALGRAPFEKMRDEDRASSLVLSIFPRVPNQATGFRLGLLALTSRYYSVPELFRVNDGYRFSRKLLNPQLHHLDLRRQVPEINVPIYFFTGINDSTFGVSIQEEYYRRLRAPHGKHFVLFKESTHWPHLEQPKDFLAEMRRMKEETFKPAR